MGKRPSQLKIDERLMSSFLNERTMNILWSQPNERTKFILWPKRVFVSTEGYITSSSQQKDRASCKLILMKGQRSCYDLILMKWQSSSHKLISTKWQMSSHKLISTKWQRSSHKLISTKWQRSSHKLISTKHTVPQTNLLSSFLMSKIYLCISLTEEGTPINCQSLQWKR